MFGVTGGGLSAVRYWQNGGKRMRRSCDQWDVVSLFSWSLYGIRCFDVPETNCLSSKVRTCDGRTGAGNGNTNCIFLVMERDRRLTGSLRGQSDAPIAPLGFELNNPWKVSSPPGTTWRMQFALTIVQAERRIF